MEVEHKAILALKTLTDDLYFARQERLWHLNELGEWRLMAYDNSKDYKENSKTYHDRFIKQGKVLKEGDEVLLFNAQLKFFPGKLKSRWSGPFTITQVLPFGTFEVEHPMRGRFKVNGII